MCCGSLFLIYRPCWLSRHLHASSVTQTVYLVNKQYVRCSVCWCVQCGSCPQLCSVVLGAPGPLFRSFLTGHRPQHLQRPASNRAHRRRTDARSCGWWNSKGHRHCEGTSVGNVSHSSLAIHSQYPCPDNLESRSICKKMASPL